jgi:hypothetical protein
LVHRELSRVRDHLREVGYADEGIRSRGLYTALEQLFRLTHEPRLEALSIELLEAEHRHAPRGSSVRRAIYRLAHALHGMGLLPRPIPHRSYEHDATAAVDPAWASWCWRWYATSTLAPRSRRSVYYAALKAGRWLANAHPETRSPDDWTREIALGFVVAVSRMTVGRTYGAELTAPAATWGPSLRQLQTAASGRHAGVPAGRAGVGLV